MTKFHNMRKSILLAVSMLLILANSVSSQQKVKVDRKEFRTDKPGFDEAWKSVVRGDKLFSKGPLSYSQAIGDYMNALLYNPENAELNYKMGVSKLYSASREQALEYFLKAYSLKPAITTDILLLTGRAYQYSGQFIEAVGKYTEYLESDTKKDDATLARVRRFIDESNSGMLIATDTFRIEIRNLGDAINSTFDDYSPVLTSDDSRLYFASRRPTAKKSSGDYADGVSDENIFLSVISNGVRGFALPLEGGLNTGFCEAPLALNNEGDRLFIYAGYKGEGDILVSELKKGVWRDPLPDIQAVNTGYPETSITLSPDGKEAFFVSARKKGLGGKDIYSIRSRGKRWTKPVNMTNLNSVDDEESVSLSRGGDTLWFSSRGHNTIGGFDIFYSVRAAEGAWGEPVNAGVPLNSVNDDMYLVQSAISDSLFFLVSNRSGGLGGLDIYSGILLPPMPEPVVVEEAEAEIQEVAIPVPERVTDTVIIIREVIKEVPPVVAEPEFILGGRVLDSESGEPLVARIDLIDPETYQVIASIITIEADGSFSVNVRNKKSYMAEVRSNGYLSDMRRIEIPAGYVGQSFFSNLYLNKITVGKKVVLNNIFFETGKAILTPASFAELDKMVLMMNENPSMRIEISGHTDNTGSAALNDRLSLDRARAVGAYLTGKGVATGRVESKGFGSSQPVDTNSTEQGRSVNRRVEFKILEF
jgi:outer membrane protein OmpA-like peptidoglycan-associated protein/tetratricopeptide (TPR) repeat protein